MNLKKFFIGLLVVVFIFAAGIGSGYILTNLIANNWSSTNKSSNTATRNLLVNKSLKSYNSVVQSSQDAVVNIFAETKVKSQRHIFEEFFGRHGNIFQIPQQDNIQRGQGSGVIISEDGYVLTNYHVVKNAHKIKVSLNNGRELDAKVIGSDQKTDLLLLKLVLSPMKKEKLPYLPFGNSDELLVGDTVLAIGNPFGLGQTVTQGIISALKRTNIGLVDHENYIQTDAAINPGNSGGALVNMKGELIGINTALYSRSGGYQGISFAVPSNLAQNIVKQLQENGKVERISLGILVADITAKSYHPLIQAFHDSQYKHGALILKVQENSLASRNKITDGLLVTSINDQEIKSAKALVSEINKLTMNTEEIILKGVFLDTVTGTFEDRVYNIQL